MGTQIDRTFKPGGTLLRKIVNIGILLATFASFGLPGLPVQASAPAAPADSCYGGAEVYYEWLPAELWTDWHYTYTSTRCADLNVIVEDLGCIVYVDAMYYSPSQGTWIDGAYDDVWMLSDAWYEPIRGLQDNVLTAVSFYSSCNGWATIKIAA